MLANLKYNKIWDKKQCFFHPKIPKICVAWKKREKGTTTHPHWPVFKIWKENSKRLWRNMTDKIWGKKQCFFTQKYLKYVWHEKNVKKAQLHTPTNLCLKFEMKTLSSYGETARTRFGAKNDVFSPKNTWNMCNMKKMWKRHNYTPPLTYV